MDTNTHSVTQKYMNVFKCMFVKIHGDGDVQSGDGDEFVFLCYSLQFPQGKLMWAPFGTRFPCGGGGCYTCVHKKITICTTLLKWDCPQHFLHYSTVWM